MKNRLLTFAGCLAVLLALAKIYEKPLLAQVRAALVQNVDEPGRNALVLTGNNDGLNPRVFLTVPPGKRFVIDQYSAGCDVASGYAMTNIAIYSSVNGVLSTSNVAPHYLQFDGSTDGVQVNYFAGTGLGPVYADGGTTLHIELSNNGTAALLIKSCNAQVSGHLISNP